MHAFHLHLRHFFGWPALLISALTTVYASVVCRYAIKKTERTLPNEETVSFVQDELNSSVIFEFFADAATFFLSAVLVSFLQKKRVLRMQINQMLFDCRLLAFSLQSHSKHMHIANIGHEFVRAVIGPSTEPMLAATADSIASTHICIDKVCDNVKRLYEVAYRIGNYAQFNTEYSHELVFIHRITSRLFEIDARLAHLEHVDLYILSFIPALGMTLIAPFRIAATYPEDKTYHVVWLTTMLSYVIGIVVNIVIGMHKSERVQIGYPIPALDALEPRVRDNVGAKDDEQQMLAPRAR
ncbi:hypothetical protein CYMTET_35633 [Cymbomonas tetramitiformis]|uniref:Uncharacterized protein n=1 Tax=Cymbomonas tetramitiformis TaxID=36881 RepID=A0AAE0F8X6_9CHLO|nr:hypothetical protein CYMTET_35633 [Cymbomonas tetramitiformis]|eukprot:gene36-54_t